jgi:ankyrin repeat protein
MLSLNAQAHYVVSRSLRWSFAAWKVHGSSWGSVEAETESLCNTNYQTPPFLVSSLCRVHFTDEMEGCTGLADLPPEIILETASYLDITSLNSLSQTTRALHAVLSSMLYTRGATHVGKTTTPLIWAVQTGHNSVIEKLLEKAADPTAIANSTTAFHKAVHCFNTKALSLLLQKVPCPSTRNASGHTPLRLAARRRRVVLFRIILDASPGKYQEDNDDWAGALEIAVSHGHVAAARRLLEAAPPVSAEFPVYNEHASTILTASLNGDNRMIELLREFSWDYWGPLGGHMTSPLHVAAEKGHVKVMQLLISYGADMNAREGRDVTPLHRAVSGGQLAAAKFLLNAGADVKAITSDGNTPFHRSAFDGDLEITALLIAAGAAVHAHNRYELTPLSSAISGGCQAVSKVLIESGATVSATNPTKRPPLFEAAELGQSEVVHLLLSRGAAQAMVADENQGFSPLAAAAHGGYTDLIQPLVDAGFDASSSLYHAVRADDLPDRDGNLPVIRELIRCGADVDYRDPTWGYVLDGALLLKKPDVLGILLEAGADISKTNDGAPVLHVAAKRAVAAEFIEPLIKHGADIRALDRKNQTALHAAVERGGIDTIQALLDAGIPTDAYDASGMTALHYAAREDAAEYARIIKQLISAGADVNAQDNDGWTPLHLATSHEFSEIHSVLTDAGADLVAPDKFGQTPLHLAASASNTTLYRRLLKLCIRNGLDYMTESIFGLTIVEEAARIGCVPIFCQPGRRSRWRI